MKRAEYARIEVRIRKPAMEYLEEPTRFQAFNIPPRSRLYGLEPCNLETVWSESLTSYVNRLAWRHGVAPFVLALQEIRPLLGTDKWSNPSPQQMRNFCGANAISVNGLGNTATVWSTVLEQLTRSSHLHLLTSSWWLGNFR